MDYRNLWSLRWLLCIPAVDPGVFYRHGFYQHESKAEKQIKYTHSWREVCVQTPLTPPHRSMRANVCVCVKCVCLYVLYLCVRVCVCVIFVFWVYARGCCIHFPGEILILFLALPFDIFLILDVKLLNVVRFCTCANPLSLHIFLVCVCVCVCVCIVLWWMRLTFCKEFWLRFGNDFLIS